MGGGGRCAAVEVAAGEDAADAQFEGFEEALFEEFVFFFGVCDEDAPFEDSGVDLFGQERPIREDVGWEHVLHYVPGVGEFDGEDGDVE